MRRGVTRQCTPCAAPFADIAMIIPDINQLTNDELRKILLEQQAILDNATVGILFSRNRNIVACNALGAEIFGYGPKEIIGRSGLDLYPDEESYNLAARRASTTLYTGGAFQDEIRYRRKNGSTFWGRTSAKAVDPSSPRDGTIWIISDISAERAVRKALTSATHELEAVFDTSFVGIAVLRGDRVLRCNQHYLELFGSAGQQSIGQSLQSLFPTEADYLNAMTAFYTALSDGRDYQDERQFTGPTGQRSWLRISARAFDSQNPDEGSAWMFEDITARKNADERVRAALAEQEVIFNNVAVGMIFVHNRIISRCNRKFCEIFGYDEGEVVGNSSLMLYPTLRDYDEDGLAFHEKLRLGQTVTSERCLRRKDGSPVWIRATGHRTDKPGDEFDVIWTFEDVTERHQAQQALLRAHDELEQRVEERTSELARTNKQLQAEVYERLQAEQRIWHVAHHDALTGLPNRSLLLDRLDQALAQAQRNKQRVAIMFLDLDRFKSINDTLGHHIGDLLLKHVADRLRESVRAVDTVSRLGGDEFVVVLHELQQPDDAKRVAQKILNSLATSVDLEGHTLYATPSIGISLYPDDGVEAYALMKNADTAMYHAKEAGRNTYQFFTNAMNEESNRLFSLEQRLRQALEQQQFVLHYQPLVEQTSGSLLGMEALVRWQDPEHGLLLPEDFIPVAEEIGLILPLGTWVLHSACQQNMAWQAEGYPAIRMAVNLSARQFRQKDLVTSIEDILHDTGMPAELLELEITESSLMHDAEETLAKLRALTEMGISLAIDDFGTGYSSLSYLKKFSVQRLKIDRGFVRDLCNDQDDAAIVSSIVAMANHLGVKPLAEGVESQAQLERLLGYGCHQFQGHYFSQPLPASAAAQLFQVIQQPQKPAHKSAAHKRSAQSQTSLDLTLRA